MTHVRWGGLVALGLAVVACGGTDDLGSTGRSAAGTTGGSATEGTGGSGTGGALPVPDAAFLVSILSNTDACVIAGGTAELGSVSEQSREAVVLDGAMAEGSVAVVACSVAPLAGSPTTFAVQALAQSGTASLEIYVSSIAAGATAAQPAIGKVSFASVATADEPYASTACNFYFTPGTPESVAPGQIWMSFDCPALVNGPSQSTCDLQQGVVFFESCLTVSGS